LDVGDKTIGVAVSDALGITAQGLETIRRGALELDLSKLAAHAENYAVGTFVVGYPKNMNGTIGERALLSEEFASCLREKFPGAAVVLWDERLTTAAAQRMLIEAGVRRSGRKKVVDKIAAVLILQGYLDSKA
jgi:putative Holliday junction resolvase